MPSQFAAEDESEIVGSSLAMLVRQSFGFKGGPSPCEGNTSHGGPTENPARWSQQETQ